MANRISYLIIQRIGFCYFKFSWLVISALENLFHLGIFRRCWDQLLHFRLLLLNSVSQIYQFSWNLSHKPGNPVILSLSTDHPLLGASQSKVFHCTGNSHVTKSSLFFHLPVIAIADGHMTRENAVFHSYHKHLRKLQTLGTM